jgi:hypothetical protein
MTRTELAQAIVKAIGRRHPIVNCAKDGNVQAVESVLGDWNAEMFKEVRKNGDRKRQLDEANAENAKLRAKLREAGIALV